MIIRYYIYYYDDMILINIKYDIIIKILINERKNIFVKAFC